MLKIRDFYRNFLTFERIKIIDSAHNYGLQRFTPAKYKQEYDTHIHIYCWIKKFLMDFSTHCSVLRMENINAVWQINRAQETKQQNK